MERLELARLLGAPPLVGEPGMSPVVIDETDPGQFMTRFAIAAGGNGPVFLADPSWSAGARKQFSKSVQARPKEGNAGFPKSARGWLCIPSGGTSGEIKLARHDEDTIAAAVRGFCAHFGVRQVNALGVLPLHHVSGLMAWMRCALTSGEYRPCDWKKLEAGKYPALSTGDWFLSLVPTQLQRLLPLPEAVAWLRRFRVIFIGGGPAWPELMEAAAKVKLPVSLSYGMTESAAMVAALRPAEFLAGARSVGAPLPHARVTIEAGGVVRVTGESIFRGYWPEWRETDGFTTEDLGSFDAQGHLQILGRRDAVIITGGKKVYPAEVETALRTTGEFGEIAVIGMPDAQWGERVVACYPAAEKKPDLAKVENRMAAALSPHQHPKCYVAVAEWPRNAQGKLNRTRLTQLAQAASVKD